LKALIAGTPTSPFITEHLLPVTGAARRSRDVATAACLAWELPGLIGAAASIVTELISHTIRQSSTMMTLVVLLQDDVLSLWVRGGSLAGPSPSPADPTADTELMIVHALADYWALFSDGDDAVTWAALDVSSGGPPG